MIERYKVEEFVYSNLQKPKRRGQGYIARCPICGDSKKHPNMRRLNIDYYGKYDEWIYKCYNGDCPENAGNIQSLYAHVLGTTWKEANDELGEKKYDSEKILAKLDGHRTYEDSVDEQGILDLDLNDCIHISDIPDGRQAQKYLSALKEFVISRKLPLRRDVRIAFKGRYQNRFILPVYDEMGELVYFQGRAMFNDTLPKYLNPVVIKENIVLNSHLFDPNKYIIVCEGQIDAWMVEQNQGTTCLGAGITDEFLEHIMPLTNKGVIVALDNPLLDESGFKNYEKLMEKSRYGKQLKYFFMPNDEDKDLNDVRRRTGNMFDIYGFVIENSYNYFKSSIKLSQVL
jgi:hypothetical protein